MEKRLIETLTVLDDGRQISYRRGENDGDLFLESTPNDGEYIVSLRKGQYAWTLDTAGLGTFEVYINNEFIEGAVIKSDPDETLLGDEPAVLVLTLKRSQI
ncbi:hypothetical protein [Pseudomonas sp. dw_358]|uniref:hypothetical protein n=1 Tax=Pseudomonas sp. dw_358 TaxID=2720083 RepID=UPI001BD6B9E0|nr:hypothetical protein [Pseudomonas sp. dw_358]